MTEPITREFDKSKEYEDVSYEDALLSFRETFDDEEIQQLIRLANVKRLDMSMYGSLKAEALLAQEEKQGPYRIERSCAVTAIFGYCRASQDDEDGNPGVSHPFQHYCYGYCFNDFREYRDGDSYEEGYQLRLDNSAEVILQMARDCGVSLSPEETPA